VFKNEIKRPGWLSCQAGSFAGAILDRPQPTGQGSDDKAATVSKGQEKSIQITKL